MKTTIKITLLALFTSGLVLIESCKKQEITPVEPVIGSSGLPDNKAELMVGQSIELKPVTAAGDRPVTRIWTIGDSIVSENYTYTFTAVEPGVYTIKYVLMNSSGASDVVYTITVEAPYTNGVFILNEGWFGHDKGSVNFWHTGSDTIETNIYAKNNPGKTLGENTQFGVISNGTLYLVSKENPSLVAVNAGTMKETGRIETLPAKGHSFLALDANAGLISTADGIYKLTLNPLSVGDKIEGVEGETGNMAASGNTIFVTSQSQGIVALNASDLTVNKVIGAASTAFITSKDGSVWYAYNSGLVKLDGATLDADTIPVNVNIPGSWDLGAWYPGSLTYSETDDAIFFLNDGGFTGSAIVYRYKLSDDTFSNDPFITLPANRVFYGSGIRVNPHSNELVATTVQQGWGDNSKMNDLIIYNASTAAQVKKISYEGFWFPSLPVFQQAD